MILQTILDYITAGEGSHISWSGSKDGSGIKPEDYPKIIPHINLGLVELCKRLPIIEDNVFIQQFPHISDYILESKYSILNTDNPELTKYIIDSPSDRFKDNIVKIERVSNEEGDILFLNNPNERYSAFTPKHNVLQLPYNHNAAFNVEYRAFFPTIPLDLADAKEYELDLPEIYLNPLLMFIGQRLTVGLQKDIVSNTSQQYGGKFAAAISEIKVDELEPDTEYTSDLLERRGFV